MQTTDEIAFAQLFSKSNKNYSTPRQSKLDLDKLW